MPESSSWERKGERLVEVAALVNPSESCWPKTNARSRCKPSVGK